MFEKISNKVIASELHRKYLNYQKNHTLFLYQSGETADLRACLKTVEDLNRPILTITNVTSTLAREARIFKCLCWAQVAVASTKAYAAQISVLMILATATSKHNLSHDFDKLIKSMEKFLNNNNIREISSEYLKNNCFFIGRGLAYDYL